LTSDDAAVSPALSPWHDAVLAAVLFAVDPVGTAGVALRACAGPARDRWLEIVNDLKAPGAAMHRVPLHIADSRLLGGLDLVATLRAGKPVAERGMLAQADGGIVMLAMAERLPAATVARLAAVLDTGEVAVERDGLALRIPTRFGVVALDEGIADDEMPSAALLDRLAFRCDLSTVSVRDLEDWSPIDENLQAARDRLPAVVAGNDATEALCGAAAALGIGSIRAPLLALRVARAAAALDDRDHVTEADIVTAGRLVLAPRATMLPPEQDREPPDAPEPPEERRDDEQDQPEDKDTEMPDKPLEDAILEAIQAVLPKDLLSQLQLGSQNRSRAQSAGQAGAVRKSKRRGRPAGVRQGDLRGGARLNVIETLRAAVPWQPLRRASRARQEEHAARAQQEGRALRSKHHRRQTTRIEVRREDFRVTRFRNRTQTTSIFVVDASGSTAVHRLAESKGAVELLLADCYVRRDQVALIAFRGRAAELVLPPTRSLVLAKRRLAGLPGGGGTPLAAGLHAAGALAETVRREGDTPIVVVLTDGTANVPLDGGTGRDRAQEEAATAARGMRETGLAVLLIDTSPRPRAPAQQLAQNLGAHYLPLPYADASAVSEAVRATSTSAQGRGAARS